jgi:hypothetical protein
VVDQRGLADAQVHIGTVDDVLGDAGGEFVLAALL